MESSQTSLRILTEIKDYMLTYQRSNQLDVVGYTGSNFAGCQDSMKSTLRYIYLLAGCAVSWKSAKQSLIISSIMAAKFIAYYEASNHGIWLQKFFMGLRIVDGVDRPLKLFCDNKSAMLYSNNNRSWMKSKYINIKFLVLKERVQSGQLFMEHIDINSMTVDPLTKGLPRKLFHEHIAPISIMSSKDI